MPSDENAPAAGGLQEIREILFGTAWRELQCQFAENTRQLYDDLRELDTKVERVREALETTARQEARSLAEKIEAGNIQHEAKHQALAEELRSMRSAAEASLKSLEERALAAYTAHRDAVKSELGQVAGHLEGQLRQLAERLSHEVSKLRREERQALSGFFRTLAEQVQTSQDSDVD